jgi:hypothetical protein
MNTEQINTLLQHFNRRNKIKHHVEVCASNTLPRTFKPPAAIVVNTDDASEPGTHWVAVYVSKAGKKYEYFDSYGFPPFVTDHLDFLNNRTVKFNQKQLQSLTSKVCGHYCLAFLYARMNGVSATSFLSTFTTNTRSNDKLVKRHVENMFKCVRKPIQRCNIKQCCKPRVR